MLPRIPCASGNNFGAQGSDYVRHIAGRDQASVVRLPSHDRRLENMLVIFSGADFLQLISTGSLLDSLCVNMGI